MISLHFHNLNFSVLLETYTLIQFFTGPMSLTLYATDQEFQKTLHYLDNLEHVSDRTNISFHVVFKDSVRIYIFFASLY